ncbi:MAG: ankyrin repeat domain-containing protein, partial [Rhodocyclaceae bacterium]|nr:ankyrin repeat domain-containing protein [Rhodocyclaceae bacterium]
MAVIPAFESLLLELRQCFGLERLSSKKQKEFADLDISLDNYQQMVGKDLAAIFEALEMDFEAARDAVGNLVNWMNFDIGLIRHTWTAGATQQQVVWDVAAFSWAPRLGRVLGNWNLQVPFDRGMPGGQFWFLPKIDAQAGKVTLPVEHVVQWLLDLLDMPMDKLRYDLGGSRAKRIGEDSYESMERSLYEWMNGTIPRVQSIADYFPDDATLAFKGAFDLPSGLSQHEQFAAALEFVRRRRLDPDSLRDQIPMVQAGRIEAVVAGESSADEQQTFVDALAARYARPEPRLIRQRLRVARAVQDGYKRLVGFLCPGVEPECPDPGRNKVLQLVGIVQAIYNLTIGAHKQSSNQAEENRWFEQHLAPWDKETIFLSILPSRFETAYKELAGLLTFRFTQLDASAPLDDWMPMDMESVQRIAGTKLRLIKEYNEASVRIERLLDRMRASSPWRALQAEPDYRVVGQAAQCENLSVAARGMAINRMRELAATPGETVCAILTELGLLLNGERRDSPKDVESRVEALLLEAEASAAYRDWQAALLQYRAKHSLAKNDFDAATRLFRDALEASLEHNCGPLRGEIARDLLGILVANRRLVPGEHEKPYRHMLAYGMAEGREVTLEDTAVAVSDYFWETLYKPYPGYPYERPMGEQQAKKLIDETFRLILSGDWDGLANWLQKNAKWLRKERMRDVRGDSVLLLWVKFLQMTDATVPLAQRMAPPELAGEAAKMAAGFGNVRRAIAMLVEVCPEQCNLPDFKGQTPLMLAANKPDLGLVHTLLKAPKIQLDVQDFRGRTALHSAVLSGSPECVDAILAHTPDMKNVTAHEANTVAHLAMKMGARKILSRLIDSHPALLSEKNAFGETPLELGEMILEDFPAFRGRMRSKARNVPEQPDYEDCIAYL